MAVRRQERRQILDLVGIDGLARPRSSAVRGRPVFTDVAGFCPPIQELEFRAQIDFGEGQRCLSNIAVGEDQAKIPRGHRGKSLTQVGLGIADIGNLKIGHFLEHFPIIRALQDAAVASKTRPRGDFQGLRQIGLVKGERHGLRMFSGWGRARHDREEIAVDHLLSILAGKGEGDLWRRLAHEPRSRSGRGNRETGHVAVKPFPLRRGGQRGVKGLSAGHRRLAPRQFHHRLVDRNPGAAAAAPAGAIVKTDLKVQPLRLEEREAAEAAPFGTHEFGGSGGNARRCIVDLRTANADPLHGLEVEGDSFIRHVTVHPMPEDMGARDVGWGGKRFFDRRQRNRVRLGRKRAGRQGEESSEGR